MATYAPSWKPTEPELGVQPIGAVSTTQNHPLGTIVRAVDPYLGEGEFIYLNGVASLAVGDAVTYNQFTGAVTRWAGTTITGFPLAFSMAANTSATSFSWFQISGNTVANVSGTVTAGDSAYWSSTATLKSASVASKQVVNCVAALANSGTVATGFTLVSTQAVYTTQRPFAQGAIT